MAYITYCISLLLFIASPAFANFTPPKDTTSLLPVNNVVEVIKKVSTIPNVDQYVVSGTVVQTDQFDNCTVLLTSPLSFGTCTYSVSQGTPLSLVETLAPANQAWAKLRAESLTAADQSSPLQNQLALIWFMKNIYPLYRK